jgi:hypothetical protein
VPSRHGFCKALPYYPFAVHSEDGHLCGIVFVEDGRISPRAFDLVRERARCLGLRIFSHDLEFGRSARELEDVVDGCMTYLRDRAAEHDEERRRREPGGDPSPIRRS